MVPLFVLDETLLREAGTPNRLSCLLDSLAALKASLRELGGGSEMVAERPSPGLPKGARHA